MVSAPRAELLLIELDPSAAGDGRDCNSRTAESYEPSKEQVTTGGVLDPPSHIRTIDWDALTILRLGAGASRLLVQPLCVGVTTRLRTMPGKERTVAVLTA